MPPDLNWNVTGWLVYDDTKETPEPATVDDLDGVVFDDFTLVPYDNQTLFVKPDREVELNVIMDNLADGAN